MPCVPQALARLAPERRPQVRHQAGARGIEAARAAYLALEVEAEVLPFIDDMAAAYAWADLAVCRAGAMTIAELQAAGLGAVLVPLAARHRRSPDQECRGDGADRRGARAAGARSDRRRRLGALHRRADRGPRRGCCRMARPRARARVTSMRRRGSRICASRRRSDPGMNDRMRRIHRIHLVGIGGSGMGGIAEVLLNLGYEVQGSDLKANAVTQRLTRLGAKIFIGHAAEHLGRGGRGRGLERRQPRQSGGRRGAREPRAGRAARGNAGRADALPLLDRGRGHARQDHHHQPGRERARRRRPRSHLRDRRAPQERRQQRAPRRGPLPGCRGRRKRCLLHAPAADDRRSSPTSTTITWRPTKGTSRGSSRASWISCTTCRSTVSRCCAPTTSTCRASRGRGPAVRHLRIRGGRRCARRQRAARRPAVALPGAARRASRRSRSPSICRGGTTC